MTYQCDPPSWEDQDQYQDQDQVGTTQGQKKEDVSLLISFSHSHHCSTPLDPGFQWHY